MPRQELPSKRVLALVLFVFSEKTRTTTFTPFTIDIYILKELKKTSFAPARMSSERSGDSGATVGVQETVRLLELDQSFWARTIQICVPYWPG